MKTSEKTLAKLRNCPRYGITELLEIMQALRSENGCPWDREQTHGSIRQDLLEETYEVVEAIDLNSVPMMREELGDVLLQVVFHCQIEAEQQHFTFDDICDELCRKLVIRHPHVFGSVSVADSDEVLKNWDSIKQETKHQSTATETLEGVCKALPALMYAQKLGKRAGRAGMDWTSAEDAFGYIRKETDELEEAMQKGSQDDIEEELGDLLFSCVNTARHLNIDAETALNGASKKFLQRFARTEQLVLADGKQMKDLPIETLDTYWTKAKEITKRDSDLKDQI
ncbi:MAG: nucleoside triphosphate pyrophosphohydrolase [Oscillospiraceae bacterium]|nr:nucleoside triphosphate pyrophosphohydrolase [Oscillospiraceae bacterium]